MAPLSALYDFVSARSHVDRAFRSQLRRVFIDDATGEVDATSVISEVGSIVADDPRAVRSIRLGLMPMFGDTLFHEGPQEVEGASTPKYGKSLGTACQSLLWNDKNGSVAKAVTLLFRSEDACGFLVSLRRLLTRNNEHGITLDLDRLDLDLRRKFVYDDARVTSGWFLDLYRHSAP